MFGEQDAFTALAAICQADAEVGVIRGAAAHGQDAWQVEILLAPLTDEEKARFAEYATLAYFLDVDLHEVIGHASGQINPGVGTPKETLKNYSSALEEARADLVVSGTVVSAKGNSIDLSVQRLLRGNSDAPDVRVWLRTGEYCRPEPKWRAGRFLDRCKRNSPVD
mgnify:CR=1 FL=1